MLHIGGSLLYNNHILHPHNFPIKYPIVDDEIHPSSRHIPAMSRKLQCIYLDILQYFTNLNSSAMNGDDFPY